MVSVANFIEFFFNTFLSLERDVPVKNSKWLVSSLFARVLQAVAGEDFVGLLKLIASKDADFRKVHSPVCFQETFVSVCN